MPVKAESSDKSMPPHMEEASAVGKSNLLICVFAHDIQRCDIVDAIATKDSNLGLQEILPEADREIDSGIAGDQIDCLADT
jgi:hypothetical protein